MIFGFLAVGLECGFVDKMEVCDVMAIDPTSESLVVGIKNFIKNMVRRQSPGAKGIFDLF